MRYLLGTLIAIIVLSLSTLGVLALWGVTPLSWEFIRKILISISIICFTVFILAGCYFLFFKNYRKERVEKQKTGRVHPID